MLIKRKERQEGEFKVLGLVHKLIDKIDDFECYELTNEKLNHIDGYTNFKRVKSGLVFLGSYHTEIRAKDALKGAKSRDENQGIFNFNKVFLTIKRRSLSSINMFLETLLRPPLYASNMLLNRTEPKDK